MYPQEKSFALRVEEMLKPTLRPEHRQLIVEVRQHCGVNPLSLVGFLYHTAVANGVISCNRT